MASEKRDKDNKAPLCKLCEKVVVHAGGTDYQSEKPPVYMAQEGVPRVITVNQPEDSYNHTAWQSCVPGTCMFFIVSDFQLIS